MTIEERVLDCLDPNEGTEAFSVRMQVGKGGPAALHRLGAKGLARSVRCPDGAWVWFRTDDAEE